MIYIYIYIYIYKLYKCIDDKDARSNKICQKCVLFSMSSTDVYDICI